jgi:uncharacterized protein YwqG
MNPISLPPYLEPFREKLEAHTRQSLRLKLTPAETGIWDSKIGGQPYWPAEMPYPTDGKGNAMRLAAQLNFAQLTAPAPYPSNGILQIFLTTNDDLYGWNPENPNDQRNFRLVWHPAPITFAEGLMLDSSGVRGEDEYFPIMGEYALEGTMDTEIVSMSDIAFERILGEHRYTFFKALGDEAREDFYRLDTVAGTKLGGYAYFTQQDPRQPESPYSHLLLQIDSEQEILWGDCGVGNWFIDPAKLAAADFSDVMYNWDCS